MTVSRKAIGFCLSLVVACAASAQPIADGFYLLTRDESAPSVQRQDGTRLLLGRAQEIAIQRSEIRSEDNANSEFWVNVFYAPEVAADSLVLVVRGRGYPSSGSGRQPDAFTVNFRVSGADHARDVSAFLDAPIRYRRHPGHELFVAFVPSKDRYRVGDEVLVELSIENIGSTPITFLKGGRYRGSTRDNQYDFSARLFAAQVPDVGSSSHFGGLAHSYTLEPGDELNEEVSLSRWFAFDRAGRYDVHGFYILEISEPEAWTDYASADFVVRIED